MVDAPSEARADAPVAVHTPDGRPPRSSKLAALSLLCTVVGGSMILLGLDAADDTYQPFLLKFGALLLVGGGLLGIVAAARIRGSDGTLRGRSKAITAAVIGCAAPALSLVAVAFFVFYACN